jgi:hypothetical protein
MYKNLEQLQENWDKGIKKDFPQQSPEKRQEILQWLLNIVSNQELESDAINQRLEYRYQILQQRYLTVDSRQGYRLLIIRLSSLMMRLPVAHTWMKHSGIYYKDMIRLLQKVIQEILEHDPHWQQQVKQIARCTSDNDLRNALVLASLEEYCLYPLDNQPLLLHWLRQYCYLHLETSSKYEVITSSDFLVVSSLN